jgi:hypothetical protein
MPDVARTFVGIACAIGAHDLNRRDIVLIPAHETKGLVQGKRERFKLWFHINLPLIGRGPGDDAGLYAERAIVLKNP